MPDSRPNDRLTLRDFYEQYWHCRDFEIKNLWQRSVFLGTFLVLCFTGYGTFFGKAFFNENGFLNLFGVCEPQFSIVFKHLFAFLIAMVGCVFSVLWIAMAKASRAWQKIYERAVYSIEKEMTMESPLHEIAGFSYMNLDSYPQYGEAKFDSDFRNTKGGYFSASKINIVLGIISFFLFALLALLHVIIATNRCFFLGFDCCNLILLVVFTLYSLFLILSFTHSKKLFDINGDALKDKDPGNCPSNEKILSQEFPLEIDRLKNVKEKITIPRGWIYKQPYFYKEELIIYLVFLCRIPKKFRLKIDISVNHKKLEETIVVIKDVVFFDCNIEKDFAYEKLYNWCCKKYPEYYTLCKNDSEFFRLSILEKNIGSDEFKWTVISEMLKEIDKIAKEL